MAILKLHCICVLLLEGPSCFHSTWFYFCHDFCWSTVNMSWVSIISYKNCHHWFRRTGLSSGEWVLGNFLPNWKITVCCAWHWTAHPGWLERKAYGDHNLCLSSSHGQPYNQCSIRTRKLGTPNRFEAFLTILNFTKKNTHRAPNGSIHLLQQCWSCNQQRIRTRINLARFLLTHLQLNLPFRR